MEEIKVLRPFSALYDKRPVYCECCGPETCWESAYFYETDIVESDRIILDGLTENVDFEILK